MLFAGPSVPARGSDWEFICLRCGFPQAARRPGGPHPQGSRLDAGDTRAVPAGPSPVSGSASALPCTQGAELSLEPHRSWCSWLCVQSRQTWLSLFQMKLGQHWPRPQVLRGSTSRPLPGLPGVGWQGTPSLLMADGGVCGLGPQGWLPVPRPPQPQGPLERLRAGPHAGRSLLPPTAASGQHWASALPSVLTFLWRFLLFFTLSFICGVTSGHEIVGGGGAGGVGWGPHRPFLPVCAWRLLCLEQTDRPPCALLPRVERWRIRGWRSPEGRTPPQYLGLRFAEHLCL